MFSFTLEPRGLMKIVFLGNGSLVRLVGLSGASCMGPALTILKLLTGYVITAAAAVIPLSQL